MTITSLNVLNMTLSKEDNNDWQGNNEMNKFFPSLTGFHFVQFLSPCNSRQKYLLQISFLKTE